jgi:hypothetical protein
MSPIIENPAIGCEAGSPELRRSAADEQEIAQPGPATQVCRELLREDIAANASILQVQLDVALAFIAVPDDVGLLYALRRCGVYWRAIGGSARDLSAALEKGRGR